MSDVDRFLNDDQSIENGNEKVKIAEKSEVQNGADAEDQQYFELEQMPDEVVEIGE